MAKKKFDYKEVIISKEKMYWVSPDEKLKIEVGRFLNSTTILKLVLQVEVSEEPLIKFIERPYYGSQTSVNDDYGTYITIAILKVADHKAHVRIWGTIGN